MGNVFFITLSLVTVGLFSNLEAQASITGKLVSLAFKPVTMPLNFVRKKTLQAVSGTARAGVRAAKGGLSNISVQAGPFISVSPF